jgi:hypothetical protein
MSQARIKTAGQELDRIVRERARWSGVAMPTDAELKRLLAAVEREHPGLLDRERDANRQTPRDFAREFKTAFFAVGSITRLPEPTQKIAFATCADRLNSLLRRCGHTEVEADVIMAAVIAWGDVDYRMQDLLVGQIAEVSLDPLHTSGRAPKSVWRAVLDGQASLRKPLSPRRYPEATVGLARVHGE